MGSEWARAAARYTGMERLGEWRGWPHRAGGRRALNGGSMGEECGRPAGAYDRSGTAQRTGFPARNAGLPDFPEENWRSLGDRKKPAISEG